MLFKTKIIIISLLASISMLSLGYATNEIGCTQSVSSFSNCTSKYIYLYQDNNTNALPDYSFVPKANYIYNIAPTQDYDLIQIMTGSNVEYYMSTGAMLYTKDESGNLGVMNEDLFRLQSRVFPYKAPIRAISAFRYVNVEVPSITGLINPIIGIKYNYVLKKAIGYNGSTTSDYRYRLVPSLDFFGENGVDKIFIQNNTKRSRSPVFNTSTCINYNIQWCGDGKKTTHTGYIQNNSFHPVTSWVTTGFTEEICDSTTETGAACVNGTLGCCNTSCSGFGGGFCGDGILQVELDETCDLGEGINGSNECSLECLIPPLDSPVDEAVIES